MNSKNAFILVDNIIDKNYTKKSIFRGIGKYKAEISDFMPMLDSELLEEIGRTKITREVNNIPTGIILPLVNEYSDCIGVIYVESTENPVSDLTGGYKLIQIYASQAASSLSNAFLHSMVNMKNEELSRTYEQLRIRYMDTIEALRQVVDTKDEYTRGHSDRVSFYCVKIAQAIGLKKEEVETLRIAGLFHDIGKMSIADDILLKNERLNSKEYEEIKKHPIKGARILSVLSMFKDVVSIVKCHHERLDGKGYPEGLKGDQIPFLAKIVSVSDAFDAMMSDRHYRTRLDLKSAIQQLMDGAGTQFDPDVVRYFVAMLENYTNIQEELAVTYE